MRIFLAGATGQIGGRLVPALVARGDQVVLLTRNPAAAKAKFGDQAQVVEGDPTKVASWMVAVDGCQAIVNLTGAGIFGRRWSVAYKKEMVDSRVESTKNVVAAIGRAREKPGVLVNGSAIGY